MWYPVSERKFREELTFLLDTKVEHYKGFDYVTGPGRSGAITAVYASHILGVPFIPHKSGRYDSKSVLVVDTVRYTGKTLRKAVKWYTRQGLIAESLYVFPETRKHYYKFWYEV